MIVAVTMIYDKACSLSNMHGSYNMDLGDLAKIIFSFTFSQGIIKTLKQRFISTDPFPYKT